MPSAIRTPYRQVDVFSSQALHGNPVAVFLEADGLSDETMQRLSNWMNLSECTFVLKPRHPKADYRVRIFGSRHEMPFAGHPTLGTAHAVLEAGAVPSGRRTLIQECGVGLVRLFVEDDGRIFFELPEPEIAPVAADLVSKAASALRAQAREVASVNLVNVGPKWLTVRLGSRSEVSALNPDMGAISRLSDELAVEGITVFASESSMSGPVEVRSFAPGVGVPEDPVCGSGNGCVAAVVRAEGSALGKEYVAIQGAALARNGEVHVRFDGDAILVGGRAITCLSGSATF